MLDWMFMLLLITAILFIILCLKTDEKKEPYWKILFISLAVVLFFILALSNLNIQTPYTFYNSTSGDTEMKYDIFVDEASTYLSYFFALMALLCMIYIIILIFDIYYQRLDEKNNENME